MKKTSIIKLVALSCIAAMSLAAPAALASGSSEGGYDEAAPLSQIQDIGTEPQDVEGISTSGTPAEEDGEVVDTPGGTVPADEVRSGTLPFTGLDVGVALLLGLALVGTGIAVRRAARLSS